MPPCETASLSCQVFRPVRILARHRLHFGFEMNAFLNRTPSRATRSKFGVFTHVLPYAPACCQPQSSKMMNKILGRAVSAARARGAATNADNRSAVVKASSIERVREQGVIMRLGVWL